MAEKDKEKPESEPKIIVDDDWKAQAQAEKEKLAEGVESPAASSAEGKAAETAQQPREMPPASFTTLISSLMTQILFALGGYEDPKTRKRIVDLEMAKHHIDMLSVIEEKTRGNLTDDEKQMLDRALYETRMQYVQIAQQASRI